MESRETLRGEAYLARDFSRAASPLRRVEAMAASGGVAAAAAGGGGGTTAAAAGGSGSGGGGGDIAAALLRERCEFLARHPPAPDWNGCEVLTQKSF